MNDEQTIFDNSEFAPLASAWNSRQRELARRHSYYDGSIYKRTDLAWLGPRFYKGARALYLPLSRAVDIDVGIVPGGWSFPEGSPQAWTDARKLLMGWSRWRTDGVLLVHYGASYGVCGLKVCDLRQQKRVLIKPLDPTKYMLLSEAMYDEDPTMALFVEHRCEPRSDEEFEYAEVITPDFIRTFRDGEPFGFDGRQPEYPNDLGFVPFVEIEHIRTGRQYGEPTYQKAIPLLDQVNQQASYLADIIAKNAEPQWAVFGAEPSDMVKSGDNIWFFPAGADAKPLLAAVDIDGVLAFIKEVADNMHGSLPELSFDELRSKDKIATATVELQLAELTIKIQRIRPNYDSGMVRGLQMAGLAAVTMGLTELSALADDNLDLDETRPVLPVDPLTQAQIDQAKGQVQQPGGTPNVPGVQAH